MKVALELTGLTKTFATPSGPFVAVRNVNLRVEPGEFVCILGHSGCGKSTVLSIMAGLQRATEGGVVIDGREVDEPGLERAVVFQAPCLLPWMSAQDNVRLALRRARPKLRRLQQDTEAVAYLELAGVADAARQLPGELSLGTQQCVSLARALALEPRFLLLDEPFSNLDSLTRFELQDTLLRVFHPSAHRTRAGGPGFHPSAHRTRAGDLGFHPSAHRTRAGDPGWERHRRIVVMVTHDIDEALYLCDRLVLMTDGPEARVGETIRVPFPRPRVRPAVLGHPEYYNYRRHVIDFLENHARQSRIAVA
jgi:nitrate/nitrite transport system ATP-binding protein